MSAPEAGRESAPSSLSSLSTLILTALPEETAALLDRMRDSARVRVPDGRRTWRGQLSGRPVLLVETGVGPENATAGMLRAARLAGPLRWIGAGLAGALAPEFSAGQLLVAGAVSDDRRTVTPGPDPAWAARAVACAGGVQPARFLTVGRIASTVAEKAALRGGTPPRFDVCDMESAAWAKAAAANGRAAPYLLVRVVSDTAGEELPELVAGSIAPDGSLDRGRIARRVLAHPGSIGKLLALRRRARSCAAALAEFLDRFAAAGF
ncbi:MAG: hypothetical protein ABI682_08345 [Acidobacteriota bacterium]